MSSGMVLTVNGAASPCTYRVSGAAGSLVLVLAHSSRCIRAPRSRAAGTGRSSSAAGRRGRCRARPPVRACRARSAGTCLAIAMSQRDMNTEATEPTAGSRPVGDAAFHAFEVRVRRGEVLVGGEEQRHVHRDAGGDRLGDGRQALGSTRYLDKQVGPPRPARARPSPPLRSRPCRMRAAARPPGIPTRPRRLSARGSPGTGRRRGAGPRWPARRTTSSACRPRAGV